MTTLFLEAFGQLSPGTNLIDSEEADLYSVFRARAELMGWSTTSPHHRSLLWNMEEAELPAGIDASRIGWVQVGLEVGDVEQYRVPPTPVPGWAALRVRQRPGEPSVALAALIQCFDDALRRFGDVDLSGIQVTASGLDPSTRSSAGGYLSSVGNWFNTTMKARANALITFNHELLGGHTEAELVASLQRRNTGSFEFGPVMAVAEGHSIKVPIEMEWIGVSPAHSGRGVSVTLPEWTASAAAWVLASVIDTALASAPDVENFAVRITRVW